MINGIGIKSNEVPEVVGAPDVDDVPLVPVPPVPVVPPPVVGASVVVGSEVGGTGKAVVGVAPAVGSFTDVPGDAVVVPAPGVPLTTPDPVLSPGRDVVAPELPGTAELAAGRPELMPPTGAPDAAPNAVPADAVPTPNADEKLAASSVTVGIVLPVGTTGFVTTGPNAAVLAANVE
jgi:hypothetical protein